MKSRISCAFRISLMELTSESWESMWAMAYMSVYYASEYLKGNKVPRLVISPVYAITAKELENVDIKKYGDTYDHPGVARELGWERSL